MDDPLLLLEGRIMVSGRCVDCYYPAAVVDIMMSSSNPYHICRQKGLVLDYTFCFLLLLAVPWSSSLRLTVLLPGTDICCLCSLREPILRVFDPLRSTDSLEEWPPNQRQVTHPLKNS